MVAFENRGERSVYIGDEGCDVVDDKMKEKSICPFVSVIAVKSER